ncbi:MAG: DUF1573 domain-containing protein [Bacteroidetes bacterium]|nr:DUF1573 domain-containing protein [Bacteroidota bacterium]HET6243129.1 DUF1573 domain-containing protein [Bacteroidia bacterium]
MIFPKLFVSLLFLLMVFSAFGQSQKKLIKYADKAFLEGDFYGASIYYKQAMDNDSSQIQLLYKYASSLRMLNEYESAEYYFEKVYKKDRGRELTETLFWLASMQKNNANYLQAKKNFKKLNSQYKKDKNNYFYKKSLKEQESCDYAMKPLINDSVVIENIGDPINSIHAEFSPFLFESDLYFSSLRISDTSTRSIVEPGELHYIKIYKQPFFSEISKDIEELDTIINSPGFHSANGTFSPDGKRFYFSRCSPDNKCKIYESKVEDGIHGISVELEDKINLPGFTSTQPSISGFDSDQEILLFVSDRNGGEGGLDIWYSMFKSGKFSTPVNAGKLVNSIENEVTPFYHTSSQTLYFSSSWHNGSGGMDIFKSQGVPGSFKEPENLGNPINSCANDLYFTIDSAGVSGFLASNRKGGHAAQGETCCNDIYHFQFPQTLIEQDSLPPTVYTTLEQINKYLPVTLYFHNDEPNPRTTDTITFKNYMKTYESYLGLKEQYKKEYSTGLKGVDIQEATEIIEVFFEDFVSKGVDDLEMFTRILFDVLKEGQQIELTVKGYASPLAKSDYNLKLTKRRISSLKNYLNEFENGIFKSFMDGTAENGGLLTLVEMPFGSFKANEMVSSNLQDLKNSVYSKAAAMERKIEIIAVSVKDSVKIRLDDLQEEKFAEIFVEDKIFNFGKINYGEVVEHTFLIKNTGDSDLIIYNASGSCGCTIPQWSKEPVLPGEQAAIKVKFDSKGKMGNQSNTVTLISNAVPNVTVLTVSAEVLLKK